MGLASQHLLHSQPFFLLKVYLFPLFSSTFLFQKLFSSLNVSLCVIFPMILETFYFVPFCMQYTIISQRQCFISLCLQMSTNCTLFHTRVCNVYNNNEEIHYWQSSIFFVLCLFIVCLYIIFVVDKISFFVFISWNNINLRTEYLRII